MLMRFQYGNVTHDPADAICDSGRVECSSKRSEQRRWGVTVSRLRVIVQSYLFGTKSVVLRLLELIVNRQIDGGKVQYQCM